jgi:hypothetical protein
MTPALGVEVLQHLWDLTHQKGSKFRGGGARACGVVVSSSQYRWNNLQHISRVFTTSTLMPVLFILNQRDIMIISH